MLIGLALGATTGDQRSRPKRHRPIVRFNRPILVARITDVVLEPTAWLPFKWPQARDGLIRDSAPPASKKAGAFPDALLVAVGAGELLAVRQRRLHELTATRAILQWMKVHGHGVAWFQRIGMHS